VKKLIALLLCAGMTGCVMNKPAQRPAPGGQGATARAAEAKLAEKFPLVEPETITADNAAVKSRELQSELDRAAKNLAAARAANDQVK
jgi:hypothetical protein